MMLFMKSIGIDKVQNFPFPSHPGDTQLLGAEQTLLNLGALELPFKGNGRKKQARPSRELTRITDLGKTMSYFPLNPRFSKMLALSFHNSVVEYTVALVAALTVQVMLNKRLFQECGKEVVIVCSNVFIEKQTFSGSILGCCID